jgi:bifunctional oligoribonuclease and PAP phosphatase NrnA
MNYQESAKILEEIKKAKRILINCHPRPDIDSVSSAIAAYLVLKDLGKEVKVVSPDPIPDNLSYLSHIRDIELIDYADFDFSPYGLFLTLDSPTWYFITHLDNNPPGNIYIVQIDHHDVRERYAHISLVNTKISSTCELLYSVFEDWNIKFTPEIATALLSGVIGDTVCFQIPLTSADTFKTTSKLIDCGADRQVIMFNQFYTLKYNLMKFFGETLSRLNLDKTGFVWSAVSYEIFEKCGKPQAAKNAAANMFFGSVKEGKFGIIMLEEEIGKLQVSLRSAGRFDTTVITKELGGGGHHDSSAASIKGMKFKDAVEKVLVVARKYAAEK